LAYQIEVERSREMAAELQFLRANAVESGVPPVDMPSAGTSFKSFVVVATLLFGVFLAASIGSTVMDLFRSANATATPGAAAVARRGNVEPHPPTSRPNPICWRDRSTRGPCF
jgi:hypothetical protein